MVNQKVYPHYHHVDMILAVIEPLSNAKTKNLFYPFQTLMNAKALHVKIAEPVLMALPHSSATVRQSSLGHCVTEVRHRQFHLMMSHELSLQGSQVSGNIREIAFPGKSGNSEANF